MEKIRCIICNSYNDKPIIKLHSNRLSKIYTFNLVECGTCKLIYLNPRFTERELISFYKDDYSPHKAIISGFRDRIYNFCQNITFKWKKNI